MRLLSFMAQPGEIILYEIRPNRKWHILIWKIISGLVGIVFLTLMIYLLLFVPIKGLFAQVLPLNASTIIGQVLCLGIFPLLGTVWVVEDTMRIFTGILILTDQRLWVSGSPYAWNRSETRLEDIASMTNRRDAVFIRLKSTPKPQVHMFSNSEGFVKAYEKFIGKKDILNTP